MGAPFVGPARLLRCSSTLMGELPGRARGIVGALRGGRMAGSRAKGAPASAATRTRAGGGSAVKQGVGEGSSPGTRGFPALKGVGPQKMGPAFRPEGGYRRRNGDHVTFPELGRPGQELRARSSPAGPSEPIDYASASPQDQRRGLCPSSRTSTPYGAGGPPAERANLAAGTAFTVRTTLDLHRGRPLGMTESYGPAASLRETDSRMHHSVRWWKRQSRPRGKTYVMSVFFFFVQMRP